MGIGYGSSRLVPLAISVGATFLAACGLLIFMNASANRERKKHARESLGEIGTLATPARIARLPQSPATSSRAPVPVTTPPVALAVHVGARSAAVSTPPLLMSAPDTEEDDSQGPAASSGTSNRLFEAPRSATTTNSSYTPSSVTGKAQAAAMARVKVKTNLDPEVCEDQAENLTVPVLTVPHFMAVNVMLGNYVADMCDVPEVVVNAATDIFEIFQVRIPEAEECMEMMDSFVELLQVECPESHPTLHALAHTIRGTVVFPIPDQNNFTCERMEADIRFALWCFDEFTPEQLGLPPQSVELQKAQIQMLGAEGSTLADPATINEFLLPAVKTFLDACADMDVAEIPTFALTKFLEVSCDLCMVVALAGNEAETAKAASIPQDLVELFRRVQDPPVEIIGPARTLSSRLKKVVRKSSKEETWPRLQMLGGAHNLIAAILEARGGFVDQVATYHKEAAVCFLSARGIKNGPGQVTKQVTI